MRIQRNPDKAKQAKKQAPEAPARRRLGVAERERQILDGAIQFFSVHGFGGQLRDLAKSIGVTHALLYHYFPTKQALVDRVYLEVFEGRWREEWNAQLDNPDTPVEDKLTAFYLEYVTTTLSREFVRILVFSGLTDHTITDRFFSMLRTRLFPRLIRETRRFRGLVSRAKPSEREIELLMGLHGGFFYITMRRWIYAQDVYSEIVHEGYDEHLVRDRVCAYLNASRDLFADINRNPLKRRARR
ncbi:TetR/AcrR family transcriptional regulator [Polaromonas sp.]|uniref:TetR/AcrR family transcriptional regulator n=1 Tax=Polaromonas sp. TaxID=1869339 RepID=UPI003750B7E9